MNIGIIGLGSIGQMLVKGFSKSGVASPAQLFVYNRTREKSEQFQADWPFTICASLQDVSEACELIFICTKPLDLYPVLQELAPQLRPTQHIVSVAAGISLEDLTSVSATAITKVIPTVTSQILHGVSLYACNQYVSSEQREQLLRLLQALGKAEEVEESVIETATILSSSGPGLIAGMMELFAQAAHRKSPELSVETTRRLLVETLLGTAMLLSEEDLHFEQLIEQVATKGGITMEGLNVMAEYLPPCFDQLFLMTQAKHDSLKLKTKVQFNEN
ncbi:pyrroline-5-carboxylate reductase family protein [Brevibacillus fulvus]|uniref:Pyrroline-5-carboxylate reductase n=1 Tax=Brevibacillus fulvus TaxID=1125967 RepID=A0A938XZN0_9BACL|nr:pyrroline-5-carboxylate reductase dimerization domain-containing protein [Brevibacillus fulvus]MBM7589814.1 pyrroline-5-carboxylate reductase [Brevibacillus fulvus]